MYIHLQTLDTVDSKHNKPTKTGIVDGQDTTEEMK